MMKRRISALLFSGLLIPGLLTGCAAKPVEATQGADGVQKAKVVIKGGYQPAEITAQAGKPLMLEFYRDEEPGQHSCGEEVVIPSENVKMKLPARESQIVEIKPQPAGQLAFQCGMGMMHGKITFK